MTGPAQLSRLGDRRALVTGASSGIGRATAIRLAQDGAAVAVNHLKGEEERAREVVEEVERGGGQAVAVAADVSKEQDVHALFGHAQEALAGPVDLLVNNAGIEMPHPLEEMPLEDWQKVLDVNLTGPFLCSRELVRRIGEPRAHPAKPGASQIGDAKAAIVNVSSVHEVIPRLRGRLDAVPRRRNDALPQVRVTNRAHPAEPGASREAASTV